MSDPIIPPSASLKLALAEFVGAVEVLLHYDWDYTTLMFGSEEPTFLQPGLTSEQESEDWGSRGAFLEKYRAVVHAMRAEGISPVFPFALDQISPNPPPAPAVWAADT